MEKNTDFDIEAYIDKRMMEITELEERVLYKEIVGNLLKKLFQYSENAYQELEARVLGEEKAKQSDYAIYLSMTDIAHYDETDTFMYPMLETDTKKKPIPCEDICKAAKEKQEIKLFTVFFKANASVLYRLIHEERSFQGVIRTEKREYKGTFVVRQNKVYQEMIEKLYDIFALNYQSWTTVCVAYLMKMMDVYLVSVEDMKKDETIQDIQVEFEEYAGMVHNDMIPLWNLKRLKEKTSTYPEPAIDKINYEHQIFAHRLESGCEYLVMNTDIEITNIRSLNGDLYITCPMDRPQEWHLYQVNKATGKEKYLYPILSNGYKESFSGSITEMYRKSIKTKAEMARLIEAFPAGGGLEFQGYELQESAPEGYEEYNYNMDGFIQDEIRVGSVQQVLMLHFSPKNPEDYLNEDIMSFLVTQVQKIFPEYLCIGKLV